MSPAAPLADLVSRAEVLYRDYRLKTVREWKARTGGLAVGYMPIYVPCELLYAQDVLPVGLMGARDDLEIIKGDAYYQSYICHIPRSTIELGLNGSLDCLDGLLFPAICDVIRNLSGMWQMLFPGKLVCYLDVPQNFDPADRRAVLPRRAGGARRPTLTAHGARPYDADALRARHRQSTTTTVATRAGSLCACASSAPWKVPTSELYLVLRATLVLPVEEVDRDAARRTATLAQARRSIASRWTRRACC